MVEQTKKFKQKNCFFFQSDVDECGNGEHNCDVNTNCFNVKGLYECLCKEGYKEDGLSCLG